MCASGPGVQELTAFVRRLALRRTERTSKIVGDKEHGIATARVDFLGGVASSTEKYKEHEQSFGSPKKEDKTKTSSGSRPARSNFFAQVHCGLGRGGSASGSGRSFLVVQWLPPGEEVPPKHGADGGRSGAGIAAARSNMGRAGHVGVLR